MSLHLRNEPLASVQQPVYLAVTPVQSQRHVFSRVQSHNRTNFFTKLITEHLIEYPTSMSLSNLWGLGFATGLVLIWQIITGIILVMRYKPTADDAFNSIIYLTLEAHRGWFFRIFHANGASLFFVLLYAHIGRGLYYGGFRFSRELVWITGLVCFILVMGTAFIGYVLPWGQMSFWGATVITNMFSSLPVIGASLTTWLWGGFSVNEATLNRFFSLHYFLPFVVLAVAALHMYFLHSFGSSKPLSFDLSVSLSNVPFYPYFYTKDVLFGIGCVIGYVFMCYFMPNYLGHPDNFIKANPMVTPAHIVPEWYFLPFYAILRSIPNKLGGVVLMAFSLLIVIWYPFIYYMFQYQTTSYMSRSLFFLPVSRFLYWAFVCDFLVLGYIGGCPVAAPYYTIGQVATIGFFLYWIIAPFVYHIEVYVQGHDAVEMFVAEDNSFSDISAGDAVSSELGGHEGDVELEMSCISELDLVPMEEEAVFVAAVQVDSDVAADVVVADSFFETESE